MGSSPDLLVEAFEHVGAFEALMMLAREPVEGERLLNLFLGPPDEFRIAGSPFGDPCGEVLARPLGRTTVVEPAQFLQAIVVGLARADGRGRCGGSGRSSAGKRPRSESCRRLSEGRRDRRRPRTRRHAGRACAGRRGNPSRTSGSRGWPCRRPGSRRRPSQSIPMVISTAWLITTPPSRTFS